MGRDEKVGIEVTEYKMKKPETACIPNIRMRSLRRGFFGCYTSFLAK